MNKLVIGKGNAKLGREVLTFSLPSGYTCPGAADCLSRANRKTGKITDGPDTQFRCFSASQEALLPVVRNARWHNHDLVKETLKHSKTALVKLLLNSLPANASKVRVHVAGDFFNQDYFDCWMTTARRMPNTLFYAYTKSIPYWVKRIDSIPSNFVLTASMGGKHDTWISQYDLKNARVVYSLQEAADLGLPVDHDDSLAMAQEPKHFALLLHGQMPKGSVAQIARQKLIQLGYYGYSDKNKPLRKTG